ncbi:MAG TPA: alcohol dehydrogenase catalytic domain-containing protein [Vicinamibacterales bacterium]|nr:alcohol dehydrogenase catalytic domain-containing protein [Vicinamibacterales bacterium]
MPSRTPRLSRRGLLKRGATAAAAVAAGGAAPAAAQGQAPAVVTGRTFRAWISRGSGSGRTTLQDVRMRAVTGRMVVVRTEATNLCYSNVGAVLGIQAAPPGGTVPANAAAPANPAAAGGTLAGTDSMALIQGHGGIGVVEAVGPEVRRVQVGDRVCVSGTPQCGACYHCLRGRADICQLLGRNLASDLIPVADLRDGTPVYSNSHIGGLGELMVTWEEWIVPVVSKASNVDLGMVCSCVSVAGLGATTSGTLATLAPGSAVAVVGCGPLGLSAVQGARIAGASIIIGIDPIRARRDVAMKVGATHVLDPNVEGDRLIERVRALTAGPTNRTWSGGRDSGGRRSGAGADLVVEAAGAEFVRPKLEQGPDPSGILPMQQAYQMASAGGHVITTGLVRGTIALPAFLFAIGGVTHSGGQAGGANPMRDIPRFVEMLHAGRYDPKLLATRVVGLRDVLGAYEEVAYRTTITALMVL